MYGCVRPTSNLKISAHSSSALVLRRVLHQSSVALAAENSMENDASATLVACIGPKARTVQLHFLFFIRIECLPIPTYRDVGKDWVVGWADWGYLRKENALVLFNVK